MNFLDSGFRRNDETELDQSFLSGQLESRPLGRAEHRGHKCVSWGLVFLGSPYGAPPPPPRARAGPPPGGGAEGGVVACRGGDGSRVGAARGPGTADARVVVAPSGVSFLLVTFLWTSKEKSPAVGQSPTSTRRP